MEKEWLGDLETRVRQVVERLGELREENLALRLKTKELETAVTTLPIRPAPSAESAAGGEDCEALRAHVRELEAALAAAETERAEAAAAARSWEIERVEVRRRVEKLVERLEELASAPGQNLSPD